MKNVSNSIGLAAIAFLFIGSVLLNNVLFDKARVDLTENAIYSISDGTKALLKELDEPINLYFFFSNENSEGLAHIRNYAARVQSLLEEYELYSDGKIKLHIVDPEPFSEAEDRAAEFGLTGAQISALGDSLYFGLGGSNALDEREKIAFFDPQKERFLEYDISKMIYQLTQADSVKVTLISGLNMKGGQPNPMTGQMAEPWAVVEQLEQLYEVETLEPSATSIPEDTKVLMLVHPKDYSEQLLYAIDQYVLKGGRVAVFTDPHAESDMTAAMGGQGPNSSNLEKLFKAWGVTFDPSKVTLDARQGLEIRMPTGGVGLHPGYIGLTTENIFADDVVFADMSSINGASWGAISQAEEATTTFAPVLRTSTHSSQIEGFMYAMQARNPQTLLQSFKSDDKHHTLAARISGKVTSAFEAAPEGADGEGHVAEGDDVQIFVVADTDVLTDQFWVQRQSFFGQTLLQAFANNGDMVSNMVENLGGSSALIGVRARGKYTRPFVVVDELKVQAQARYLDEERALQTKLNDLETQLTELQAQQGDQGALVLSAEQEQAIEQFGKEKLEIRKALREVQHQLVKDIEALGTKIKFINIALMPLLLVGLLALLARRNRRKAII